MASVNDVIEYAKILRRDTFVALEDRCCAVRNRNSTCRKCVDACMAGAIVVENNSLAIDSSACINCGVCVGVCPTNAILSVSPSEKEIYEKIADSIDYSVSRCVISCSRLASKHEASAELYCEVPCLGYIDERIIASIAAAGVDDIILADGICDTCKFGQANQYINISVDVAAQILESCNSSAIITRMSDFPEEIKSHGVKGALAYRGEDRRGLLAQTGGYIKDVAGEVAGKMVNDKLGNNKPKPARTLAARLAAGKSGHLPHIEPSDNYSLLEHMEKITEQGYGEGGAESLMQTDAVINTRRFGHVEVEIDACSGCGLCVMFCTTGALEHEKYDKPENPAHKYLAYNANMCLQCRLCSDICMRNCLKVTSMVAVADLFNFEPQLIEIKCAEQTKKLFQRDY
jgi:ferredoxin